VTSYEIRQEAKRKINEEIGVFVFNYSSTDTIGIDDVVTTKQLREIADIMDNCELIISKGG
jgi:hypothetical protein